jgi:hypothetical protein
MYKLYLDDERFPKLSNDWVIVRDFEEFKNCINTKGIPSEISFDHDLGTFVSIKKIISGGQTGADRGGLIGAYFKGIPTGGTAPKGFRTENGSDYSLKDFGLVEDSVRDYPPRTRKNVDGSDVTVIFDWAIKSPGSKLTMTLCSKLKKPCIYFGKDVVKFHSEDVAELLLNKLIETKVKNIVLNVAGNREASVPGIQSRVAKIIEILIEKNNKPSGFDCASWLIRDKKIDTRKISINVHSANSVGRDNIESLVRSWNKFLDNEDKG